MPATAAIFLLGAAAISALPPLNGFASEVMYFQAFLSFGSLPDPFLAVLLFATLAGFALMSALAAACFVKAFSIVFLAVPRSPEAAEAHEAPRPMLLGPGLLALACIVLGVGSSQLLHAAGLSLPVPNLLPVGLALLGVGLVTWLLMRRTRVRVDETWGCGILSQNGRMEYTASGFSEPILTIFSPIFRTRKHATRTFYDKTQALLKEGRAEIATFKLFEERLYLPLAHLAERLGQAVSRLQNADLDTFIFYTFLAIVLIMVVVGFWL
jgi:NADH:ubiquinone oxidoreductase subunit 5 (subunit L)/multisubunit Na+/H+ antiporter MnhA subunit